MLFDKYQKCDIVRRKLDTTDSKSKQTLALKDHRNFVELRWIDKWPSDHSAEDLVISQNIYLYLPKKRLKLLGIGTSSEMHLVLLCPSKINVFTHNTIGRKNHPFVFASLLHSLPFTLGPKGTQAKLHKLFASHHHSSFRSMHIRL